MGRRPNQLILQYFERGPKLQDQSNRYPHTCKACGEHFPRGRLDTLTGHLTKKCPGISESDRVNALLTLSGMSSTSQRLQSGQHVQQGQLGQHAQHAQQMQSQANGPAVDLPMAQHDAQRDWTALGMLAEVSRVFTQVERNDDQVQSQPPPPPPPGTLSSAPQGGERFELQPQFSSDNQEAQGVGEPTSPREADMTAEERIQEILRAENANSEPTNLTMAAAATARLQPGLLDPQLLGAEAAAAAAAATAAVNVAVSTPVAAPATASSPHSPIEQPISISTPTAAQPWGEITYPSEGYNPSMDPTVHSPAPVVRGGFRLETAGANGAKSRHSRQRFTPERREQVKDVRKLGACIRCRILRKTCSKGEPCDTCRKVLSPRIWRNGCTRAKFTEQLDMYQASVQIVMAQGHINNLKQSTPLVDRGLVVEAYNFPDQQSRLRLHVLQRDNMQEDDAQSNPATGENNPPSHNVVMLDSEKQDIPTKIEDYMRDILPELIDQEPSHFVQVTLRQGLDLANAANDELLKKAIELWGHVELVNRERQWIISINPTSNDPSAEYIKEDTHQEVFTTICLQITAAAERKASTTSRSLLTGMQRVLQDSKVKMDFNMYLTAMILLNCIEKSTWAFKAWEQPNLRIIWPLPKEPATFLRQGYVMSDLLRMLLVIRKVQPRTACRESDGKLVTDEEDPTVKRYFESINLDFAEVKAKQEKPVFSPADPRSFEFLFCSTLLLPSPDKEAIS